MVTIVIDDINRTINDTLELDHLSLAFLLSSELEMLGSLDRALETKILSDKALN